MDRLTLPKIVHKVKLEKEPSCVRHGSVPGGDSLPAWERLPLDAKFPMIPAPKGSVVLATTELCQSKHCTNKDHDFDLTDPCAHFMSNVYRPLHDPHLKAHFNSPYMRQHLIRNTFITEETKVICTLREFNEYRQYLRKICLLELARERRQKESEGRVRDDASERSGSSAKELEIRRRIREQEEREKERYMLVQATKEKRLERHKRDLEAQHLALELRGRQEDDRRRHLLIRQQEQENDRILGLVKRWIHEDRIRNERLETMKKQQMLDSQQKLASKWEERKRIQEERLAGEAEKREKLSREKRQSIEKREKMVEMQRVKQEDFLRKLRNRSVQERTAEQTKYEERMREKLASGDYPLWTPQGRRTRRRHRFQTPFQSMWVLEEVLRKLSIPDIYASSSPAERASKQRLLDMLNDAIDEAVDLVSSSSDRSESIDSTDSEAEKLRDAAQAVVRCTIEKVTKDVYPAYLKYLEEEGGTELNKFIEEYGISSEDENSDSDSDHLHSRSVRFNSTKELIPSAVLTTASRGDSEAPSSAYVALKPVSAHQLTPMPSDFGVSGSSMRVMIHSVQRIHIDLQEEETVDKQVVISALNVLLDDVTEGRCSRAELELLAEYAMDIVSADESSHASTSTIANDLVDSTLKAILNDLQSGKVSDEDITRLTLSVVGKDICSGADHTKSESDPVLLDNFIAATLKKILDELDQESWSKETLRNLAIAISSSFVENFAHNSTVANMIVSETLRQLVSSLAREDCSCPNTESSALANTIVSQVLTGIANRMSVGMNDTVEPDMSLIANMVVSEALKQLANHMSLSQPSQHDIGSSIFAERIVSDTLHHLVMYGPFRVCFPSDENIDESISHIADMIVRDTLTQLERHMPSSDIMADEEQEKGGDSSVIANKIVGEMLRQLVKQRSLGDDSNTSSISSWVVGITLKQLAGIISTNKASDMSAHFIDKIDEEHDRLAREIVSATLKQLGNVISSCRNTIYGDSSSFIADSLVSETMKQLTRAGPTSTMSTIREGDPTDSSMFANNIVTQTLNELTKGQNISSTFADDGQKGSSILANRVVNETLQLLGTCGPIHTSDGNESSFTNSSTLASKVVAETLMQLTQVISLNDSQYSSVVASRIVSEMLRQLAMTKANEHEDQNYSELASKIVNVTLKCLQDSTPSHLTDDGNYTAQVLLTPCMVHKIVSDTLLRLVDAVSTSAVDMSSDGSVEHDFSLMARKIVHDTFAELANVLSIDESTDQEISEDAEASVLASQIVHETLKQMASALSISTSAVVNEQDGDNLHIANTIIRNTMDQLANVMPCGGLLGMDEEQGSSLLVNEVISDTLKQLANAMSSGTRAVSDGDDLSDSLIAARLVNSILKRLELGQHPSTISSASETGYEQNVSKTAHRVVSDVLRQLAEDMQTSTTSIGQASALDVDSSILANQVVHDILSNLAEGFSESDEMHGMGSSVVASRIVRECLKQLETSELNNQNSDGCSVIAGTIAMDVLRKLATDMSSESHSLHDMASSLMANTIVNEVLGHLAISSTANTSQDRQILLDSLTTQKTVDSIFKQMAKDIDEHSLSNTEIQAIAEAIVSAYQVVDVPGISVSQVPEVQEFVAEILANVLEKLQKGQWTDSDLADIGHSLAIYNDALLSPSAGPDSISNENAVQSVKHTIGSIQCLARSGGLSRSEVGAMAQCLVEASPGIVQSAVDTTTKSSVALGKLREKFSVEGFSTGELKAVTTLILQTCRPFLAQSDLHSALSKATHVMKIVNYLRKLAIDIEIGAVSPFVVHSLACAIAKCIPEGELPLAFSDVQFPEFSSHIRGILQQIMIRLSEGATSLLVAERIAATVLDINVTNLASEEHTDTETWNIISRLVDRLLRETAEILNDSIANLTPSEVLQLQSLGQDTLGRTEECTWSRKGSLKDLDSSLLESFVRGALEKVLQQTANVESLDVSDKGTEIQTSRTHSSNECKEPACISRAVVSIVNNTLQRIINSLEENKISESDCATLSALAFKAHTVTQHTQCASQRSVDARTTKSVLEAISHTYSDLGDILFTPVAATTDHVEVVVRRALAKLINDIDNQRLPLSRIESLRENLLDWWNGTKDHYTPSYKQLSVDSTDSSNIAQGVVGSLIQKLKSEATLIGPVREHESRSAIKITDNKVKSFVKNLEVENPSLLRAASKQSVATSSTMVAEEIVQTLLRVLQDDSWAEEQNITSSGTDVSDLAMKAVQSLMRHLKSEDVVSSSSGVAQDAVVVLLQNMESGTDSQSDMSVKLTVERVRSFVKNLQRNDPSLLKAISVHSTTSSTSSLVAEELVQTLLRVLVEESWTDSDVMITAESNTSELALKAVQSIMKILVPCDVTMTVSELADEAVGVLLQRIKADTTFLGGESYSAVKLNEEIVRSFVKNVEKEDPVMFQTASKHSSSSMAAEELVQTLIAALKEDKSDKTDALTSTSSGTNVSEIAILAVQSLIRRMLSGETSTDEEQIQTFVRKLEQGDSGLLKAISEHSAVSSTSVVAETVVKVIMEALEVDSQEQAIAKLASVSNTSEIAGQVVESVIKRLATSTPIKSADQMSKSAESAVNSLVDTIHKDVQKTILPGVQPTISDKVPGSPATVEASSSQFNINIDSVKTVLLKVILDVSENRLSADLVERIAAVSAGEMMRIFCDGKQVGDTSQDVSDSKNAPSGSDSASSSSKAAELAVIATLQSIMKDIEKGHLNLRELSTIFRAEPSTKDASSPDVGTSLHMAAPSPTALTQETGKGTPACTTDTAVEELAELLSTITKSYSSLPKLASSPAPVVSVADTAMATAGESSDRDLASRESSRISILIRETLTRVLTDIKLNKLPLDSVCDIASCIVSSESESFKQERVRSWVAQSRMFSEESHLIEAIASETIKNTLERIRQKNISHSELRNIAKAVSQQMPTFSESFTGSSHSDEQIQDFVRQTLEKILADIQRLGLPNKPTQSLVNTVLEIAMNNEQTSSESASSVCPNKIASLVSGVLQQITMNLRKSSDEARMVNSVQDTGDETHVYIAQECDLDDHSSSGLSIDDDSVVKIAPTVGGKPLHLDSATAAAALSAISIRGGGATVNPHDALARNSFRNLLRPELTRTEALSHDRPEILESKLIRVSQRNLNRVQTEEAVDMTTILEDSSSLTCSSSSAESTREDIDGKLENVIQLSAIEESDRNTTGVVEEETALPKGTAGVPREQTKTPADGMKKTQSSEGKSSLFQRSSKSSSKTMKQDSSKSSVNSNVGSKKSSDKVLKSKHTTATTASRSSGTEMKKVKSNNGSIRPSVTRLYSSPSVGKPPKPIKSSTGKSVSRVKKKGSEIGREGSRKALQSPSKGSGIDQETIEVSSEPARVQSLCGSHTSSITVRSVGSAKTVEV